MSQTKFIDLTHVLNTSGMSIYPGDPPYCARPHASVEKDGYGVLSLEMGTHSGTHVDAPSHFFADGKTVDQIPISSLVGPALVVDVSSKKARERITWDDLEPYVDGMREGVMLLIYTGWSKYWGQPNYLDHPYLTRDVAERVLATGITFIGVDSLNPDQTGGGSEDFGFHEVFLGAGAIIAENLNNLHLLKDGEFTVSVVPLKVSGGDGAPVRAFAQAC